MSKTPFNEPVAGFLNRRRFAGGLAGLAVTGLTCRAIAEEVAEETEDASSDAPQVTSPVRLMESAKQSLYRVRLAINVKGNVEIPVDPLVSRESKGKLPITSDAVFDYEERYRYPRGASSDSPVLGVERYYHEAASEGTLNKTPHSFQLREEVRQTIARRDTLPEVLYCQDGHFNHEELGLLRTPVSAVSMGNLLPTEAVLPGAEYEPDKESIAALLNISSFDAGEHTFRVESIDANVAKIKLRGKVDGSVDGVPTLIRYIGKLTFDRQQQACTWLALAVHETRDIGKAEPGFDVSATVRLIRQPLAKPIGLPDRPIAVDLERPIAADKQLVQIESDRLRVHCLMDRRWRLMKDAAGSAMLRMIEHENSIGQCNLKPLVRLPEGQQWTLEAFERDVRGSMKGQAVRFLQGNQRLSASGVRVLQLSAVGKIEGVDIRWIFQHLSDDLGNRLLATFVADSKSFDKLAGSEYQFADTLTFIPVPEGSPTLAEPEEPTDSDETKKEVTSAASARRSRVSLNAASSASDRR